MITTVRSSPESIVQRMPTSNSELVHKTRPLIDLITYRDLLIEHNAEFENRVAKFKKKIFRNLAIIILGSLGLSFIIMSLNSSNLLIFFSVILFELAFMVVIAAYVPRLSKVVTKFQIN